MEWKPISLVDLPIVEAVLSFEAFETIEHIIAYCEAYKNIRERIIQEFEALCSKSKNGLS